MEKTEDKQDVKDTQRGTDHKGNKRRADKSKKRGRIANLDGFPGDHDEFQGYIYGYDSATRANQCDKTKEKFSR